LVFEEEVEEVTAMLDVMKKFKCSVPHDVPPREDLTAIETNFHHSYLLFLPLTEILDTMALIG
jgi:hypothetical protein